MNLKILIDWDKDTRPKGEKIARAKIAEARRWGRRAGASEAEGRANQMKFDIFDKRPTIRLPSVAHCPWPLNNVECPE